MLKLGKFKKLLILVLILWVCTLGIHIERVRESTFKYPEGDPQQLFSDGSTVFYANTWIGGGNRSRLGIPYLLDIVKDVPPYTLSFAFTARPDRKYSHLTINSLHIEYTDGGKLEYTPSDTNRKSVFKAKKGSNGKDEIEYYIANISFPEIISSESSFWVTIDGTYTFDGVENRYQQKVFVKSNPTYHAYPGWIAIALKRAFVGKGTEEK